MKIISNYLAYILKAKSLAKRMLSLVLLLLLFSNIVKIVFTQQGKAKMYLCLYDVQIFHSQITCYMMSRNPYMHPLKWFIHMKKSFRPMWHKKRLGWKEKQEGTHFVHVGPDKEATRMELSSLLQIKMLFLPCCLKSAPEKEIFWTF